MALELGRRVRDDRTAIRLYELISEATRMLTLADRLRVFGAFKRGDSWEDLDPVVQDAFRFVSQRL